MLQRDQVGFGTFVRKPYHKNVPVIDSNSDYVFWIEFKSNIFPENEPLIKGVIFIQPETSR